MVTFLASGLWHGASWGFVVWGGLHGLYQVIGYELRGMKDRINEKLHTKTDLSQLQAGAGAGNLLPDGFCLDLFPGGQPQGCFRLYPSDGD